MLREAESRSCATRETVPLKLAEILLLVRLVGKENSNILHDLILGEQETTGINAVEQIVFFI